jgi:hypothetical protein
VSFTSQSWRLVPITKSIIYYYQPYKGSAMLVGDVWKGLSGGKELIREYQSATSSDNSYVVDLLLDDYILGYDADL